MSVVLCLYRSLEIVELPVLPLVRQIPLSCKTDSKSAPELSLINCLCHGPCLGSLSRMAKQILYTFTSNALGKSLSWSLEQGMPQDSQRIFTVRYPGAIDDYVDQVYSIVDIA